MRQMVLAFITAVAVALGAHAASAQEQPANPAIQSVITQQLDAFKRDDGPGAFAFASPNIQGLFQSHQRFMAMVARGYRPLYRSAEATFLKLETVNGRLIQKVLVRGAGGRVVVAAYDMIEIDGTWRING